MTSFFRGLDRQAIGPAFESSLSLLGVEGTIADAIPADSPAAGKVRAKDGARAAVPPRGGDHHGPDADRLRGGQEQPSDRAHGDEASIPFRWFADVTAAVEDNGELGAAIQQAF